MKSQVSIAGMMAVVLIAAVNVAVARALLGYNAEILIGIALSGLTLQAAIFRLTRRGSNRVFWAGFVSFGMLAAASFIWGMILPRGLVAVASPGQAPRLINVSWASAWWLGYARSVGEILEPWLGHVSLLVDPDGIASVVIRSLVWSAPQLLAALVGGLCALVTTRAGGTRFSDRGGSRVASRPGPRRSPA